MSQPCPDGYIKASANDSGTLIAETYVVQPTPRKLKTKELTASEQRDNEAKKGGQND